MKVKIKDKIYNSQDDGPIMIILTDHDKEVISKMPPEAKKYCQFQKEDYTEEEIDAWMADPTE